MRNIKVFYTRMCYKHMPEYVKQSKKSTLNFMYRKYHLDEKYSQKKHTKFSTRLLFWKKKKNQLEQVQLVN